MAAQIQDAFALVIFLGSATFFLWIVIDVARYLWRTRHRINRRRHIWPRTAGHPDFFSQHRRVESDQE